MAHYRLPFGVHRFARSGKYYGQVKMTAEVSDHCSMTLPFLSDGKAVDRRKTKEKTLRLSLDAQNAGLGRDESS